MLKPSLSGWSPEISAGLRQVQMSESNKFIFAVEQLIVLEGDTQKRGWEDDEYRTTGGGGGGEEKAVKRKQMD